MVVPWSSSVAWLHSPVQATPLRVKDAGAVLVPDQLPLKPNDAEPFVAMTAL